jgi:phage-related protein
VTGPIDTAYVEIEPDLDRFTAKLKRQLDAAFAGLRESAKMPVRPQIDESDINRQSDHVTHTLGKKGEDAGRQYRVGFARGFLSQLGDIFRPLGDPIPLIGAVGKAMGGQLITALKIAAVAGVAQLGVELVGALAPAVGALGLLPAAALGAGLAFGTLKIALSGMGDALKAGLSGDVGKFAEALKTLAPAAQDTVREIVALKPALDKIRETVQQNFFAGLATDVKTLGATYLPILRTELGALAAGFNTVIVSLAALAATPAVVTDLSTSLHNAGLAVTNITSILPGLLRAFIDIAQVGSTFLPDLTSGLAAASNEFASFISHARESGQLEAFISGGLSAIGDLLKVLGQVGSILTSVFTAANAAGGGLLSTLGGLLANLAAFLTTAQGAQALQAIFAGLATVGNALGQALGAVLPALGGALASIAPLLGQVATNLAPALAAAIQGITPLLGLFSFVAPLSAAIATLLPVIGQLAGVIGSGLAAAVGALVPGLQILATALTSALAPVLPVLVDLFSTLAPIIGQLATTLASLLAPILQTVSSVFVSMGPIIQEIATVLGGVLVQALTELQPLFDALGPAIAQLAAEFLPQLIPLIDQFGQLLMAWLPILGPIVDLLIALMPTIIALSEGFQITLPLLTGIVAVLAASTEGFVAFASAIISTVGAIFGWISSAQAAVGGWSGIWESIKSIFADGIAFISNAIGSIVSFFAALPGRVAGAIGGIPAILSGLWASAMGAAISAVSSGIAQIVSFLAGLPGRAASALSGVGGAVMGAFAGAGGWLLSAGRNIVQGLINGIEGMIGSLQSTLGRITSLIPDWKGPRERDRRLLRPAGQAIITGLGEGIGDRVPDLRRQLESLTGDIPLTVVAGATPVATSPATTAVPVQPVGVDHELLARLIGQEVRKAVNGLTWRMTDVDRVVSSALGQTANLNRRGG